MFINNYQDENLTDEQWDIAHAIAKALVETNTDVNELKKVISYLRDFINRDNIGSDFFKYLKVLVKYGSQIAHSNQTPKYYLNLEITCKKYLENYKDNPLVMLTILGWAARLMQYYKVSPVGESVNANTRSKPVIPERKKKIEDLKKTHQFQEGNILEAKVIKKSQGNKVTYEIEGIKYQEKEPKNFDLIPENKTVKVMIKSLKEDGSINHIKFYEK